MKKSRDTSLTIGHMLEELDEWSLRAFMVDIKLMYYRCVNTFGFDRSSRSYNLRSFVCPVQTRLELSIFSILA